MKQFSLKNLRIFKKTSSNAGFSLAEVMIASLMLALTTMGLVVAYIRCIELNQLSQNMFVAMAESKNKMEEIKNAIQVAIEDPTIDVLDLVNAYHGVSFLPAQTMTSTARGISYVTNLNPDLVQVTVSFSWRQKNGRVVGEDLDLDGVMDAGEDINANGLLDSMAQITSYIYTK